MIEKIELIGQVLIIASFVGIVIIAYTIGYWMSDHHLKSHIREDIEKNNPKTKVNSFDFDNVLRLMNATSDDDLKSILSGMQEALIVINSHLLIEDPISDATKAFFGSGLVGKKITDVLFSDYEYEKDDYEMNLEWFFNNESLQADELDIRLLPEEIHLNDKTFKINYFVPQGKNKLFIFISDNTFYLSSMIKSDQSLKQIEMISEVMNNQKVFFELIDNFKKFITGDELLSLRDLGHVSNNYNAFVYKLHDFSARFKKMKMYNTCDNFLVFEASLKDFSYEDTIENKNDLMTIINRIDLKHAMEIDLEILRTYLPTNLFSGFKVAVSVEELRGLEDLIKSMPDNDIRQAALEKIWKIKFIEIKNIILRMDQFASELAKEMNKKINPIHYMGPNKLVDEELIKDLLKGLNQLIQNSIEHGIELPAERFRNNKKEYGNITVQLIEKNDALFIVYEDDGCGLDVNLIKESLYQNKILSFDEIVTLTDQEVMNFIFLEGVSTDLEVVGKGNGLFRMKESIQNMGGKISVESEINHFIRFNIELKMKLI